MWLQNEYKYGEGLPQSFFFNCSSCGNNYELTLNEFIIKELPKIVDINHLRLKESYKKGNLKFYNNKYVNALQFRKSLGKIEAGTMVCFDNRDVQVIRGFPKIRRTLMLSKTLEKHFNDEVAVEEKMNGYNVRIVSLNNQIIAFTRGGYICPYTTKKAPQLMDLNLFFKDHPDLVICGEMLGTENPYVSHYYPEIGKLGFRIFDIREKLSNQPLSIKDKRNILKKYGLPSVRLLGVYSIKDAPSKLLELIKELGEDGREGVVIKDLEMQVPPLKYTTSQAHDDELVYAFNYPFDLGKAFFFSRVIREGFQAYEMNESQDDLEKRAQRLGESILYPMMDTIRHVGEHQVAGEDVVMDADTLEEAEEFVQHLHDLGVLAKVMEFKDGKAVIRRIHQSTTDKINNYINGGLY